MTVEPSAVLLGRYEVSRIVAQGSMGSLYLGIDQRAGRKVAIKTVRFDPMMSEEERVQLRGWFAREVKALRLVQHPHILQLIDYDEFEDEPYSITEWLDGADLSVVLDHTTKMPPAIVAAIGEQLAGALAAAHDANVIHRDVKPSNAFLTPQGRAVLLDFGLARGMATGSSETMALSFGTGMVGTPHYMAPEVVFSGESGTPADVYALGATLFTLATGEPPFPGTNPLLVLDKIRANERPLLGDVRRDYPKELVAVIENMLAVAPADRPSAQSAQQRLRRVLDVSSSVSVLAEFAIAALHPTDAKTEAVVLTEADTHTGIQSQPLPIPPPNQGEDTSLDLEPPKTEILSLKDHDPAMTTIHTVAFDRKELARDDFDDEEQPQWWPWLLAMAMIALVTTVYVVRVTRPVHRTVLRDRAQATDPIALPKPVEQHAPLIITPQKIVAGPVEPRPATAPVSDAPKKPGTLVIALAIWAKVSVDGLDMGSFQTVFRTELDAGTHHVVVSHPKYGERRLEVAIKPGETTQRSVDLKAEETD